jgi:Pyridine nucleotide-disulphide oxidoreductase
MGKQNRTMADTNRISTVETDARNARARSVVIVGGGFGGLAAAKALRKAPVQLILIERTNHHLFQPLLYQVVTAVLASSQITSWWPLAQPASKWRPHWQSLSPSRCVRASGESMPPKYGLSQVTRRQRSFEPLRRICRHGGSQPWLSASERNGGFKQVI